MPYFIYPQGASYDIRLAPFGPRLIAAVPDLDGAIKVAKKNDATIEYWENGRPIETIEYDN